MEVEPTAAAAPAYTAAATPAAARLNTAGDTASAAQTDTAALTGASAPGSSKAAALAAISAVTAAVTINCCHPRSHGDCSSVCLLAGIPDDVHCIAGANGGLHQQLDKKTRSIRSCLETEVIDRVVAFRLQALNVLQLVARAQMKNTSIAIATIIILILSA